MKMTRTERLQAWYTARLQAWYNGDLEDIELSWQDVRELEKRVFTAIAKKTLERDDVHTFAEHRTLQ